MLNRKMRVKQQNCRWTRNTSMNIRLKTTYMFCGFNVCSLQEGTIRKNWNQSPRVSRQLCDIRRTPRTWESLWKHSWSKSSTVMSIIWIDSTLHWAAVAGCVALLICCIRSCRINPLHFLAEWHKRSWTRFSFIWFSLCMCVCKTTMQFSCMVV